MKICVLIPSYNEARTIGQVIRDVRARNLAAYVVDDGSSDNTAAIAASEGAVVIRQPANKGKGAALREGFKNVLAAGFDAVIAMDADGQHSADDIDNLIRRMDGTGADMIIGNRMDDTAAMPGTRVYTNRFMSHLISMVAGQYIPDSQSGYRLIKRKVLETISLESSNYEIESEMIIMAARSGFRIEAAPIKTVYQDEKSRINPVIDTWRFILFMVKIAFRRGAR